MLKIKPLAVLSFLTPLFYFAPVYGGGPEGPPPFLAILYSGNTLEEIKPCGCSREADYGGMLRRGTAVKGERKKNEALLLVDVGDNLKGDNPQGPLKADLMGECLAEMSYDAVLTGEQDFKYGPLFFGKKGFDGWLASNLQYGKKKFQEVLVKEFPSGFRLGVLGLVDDAFFKNSAHIEEISAVSPEKFLMARLAALKEKHKVDAWLLLFHGPESAAKRLWEDFRDIKIMIVGHAEDPENEKPKAPLIDKNGRGIFFADNRGRRLGKIEMARKGPRGDILLNHQWIVLDETFADDPALAPYFTSYQEKVKNLFLERAETQKRIQETTPYASAAECLPCHEEIGKAWKETGHSRALETLRAVGHSHDPECVKCHVVGFESGGYVSETLTPELGGVQCEACHGPGKGHIQDPTVPYVGEARNACGKCHTRAKDPRFSFEAYWRRVRH